MDIRNERDARLWAASWIATTGGIRNGIMQATVGGLHEAMAIVEGAPRRYAESERADLREAIAYLESDFLAAARDT